MKKNVSTALVFVLLQLILLCSVLQVNSQTVDSQIPTQLTTDTNTDRYPAALRDNTGKIWVFFESNRLGGSPSAIWYRTSVDDGENWSDPQLLVSCLYPTSNTIPPAPGHFGGISAMQDSTGKIWVVFGSTSPPDGRNEVWLMTSDDGGNAWSNPKKPYEICSPWPHYAYPTVVEGFGKIWIIFHGWSPGEETGFKYVSSDDGGLTWSSLANFPAGRHVFYPQAIRDASDNIWVFNTRQPDWYTEYARNISYVRSSDGVTWSQPSNVEEMEPGPKGHPWAIQESSGKITVFFNVPIAGVEAAEIFYVESDDDGATWSDPEQFTEDPNRDWDPTAVLTEEGLLVFWVSNRSGNWDIWCRLWPRIPPVENTEDYIEYVNGTAQDLPDEIFNKTAEDAPDLKNDFSDLLNDTLENVDEGNYEAAIEKLNRIEEEIYEEIVESDERQEIISMINDLIEYLESLL